MDKLVGPDEQKAKVEVPPVDLVFEPPNGEVPPPVVPPELAAAQQSQSAPTSQVDLFNQVVQEEPGTMTPGLQVEDTNAMPDAMATLDPAATQVLDKGDPSNSLLSLISQPFQQQEPLNFGPTSTDLKRDDWAEDQMNRIRNWRPVDIPAVANREPPSVDPSKTKGFQPSTQNKPWWESWMDGLKPDASRPFDPMSLQFAKAGDGPLGAAVFALGWTTSVAQGIGGDVLDAQKAAGREWVSFFKNPLDYAAKAPGRIADAANPIKALDAVTDSWTVGALTGQNYSAFDKRSSDGKTTGSPFAVYSTDQDKNDAGGDIGGKLIGKAIGGLNYGLLRATGATDQQAKSVSQEIEQWGSQTSLAQGALAFTIDAATGGLVEKGIGTAVKGARGMLKPVAKTATSTRSLLALPPAREYPALPPAKTRPALPGTPEPVPPKALPYWTPKTEFNPPTPDPTLFSPDKPGALTVYVRKTKTPVADTTQLSTFVSRPPVQVDPYWSVSRTVRGMLPDKPTYHEVPRPPVTKLEKTTEELARDVIPPLRNPVNEEQYLDPGGALAIREAGGDIVYIAPRSKAASVYGSLPGNVNPDVPRALLPPAREEFRLPEKFQQVFNANPDAPGALVPSPGGKLDFPEAPGALTPATPGGKLATQDVIDGEIVYNVRPQLTGTADPLALPGQSGREFVDTKFDPAPRYEIDHSTPGAIVLSPPGEIEKLFKLPGGVQGVSYDRAGKLVLSKGGALAESFTRKTYYNDPNSITQRLLTAARELSELSPPVAYPPVLAPQTFYQKAGVPVMVPSAPGALAKIEPALPPLQQIKEAVQREFSEEVFSRVFGSPSNSSSWKKAWRAISKKERRTSIAGKFNKNIPPEPKRWDNEYNLLQKAAAEMEPYVPPAPVALSAASPTAAAPLPRTVTKAVDAIVPVATAAAEVAGEKIVPAVKDAAGKVAQAATEGLGAAIDVVFIEGEKLARTVAKEAPGAIAKGREKAGQFANVVAYRAGQATRKAKEAVEEGANILAGAVRKANDISRALPPHTIEMEIVDEAPRPQAVWTKIVEDAVDAEVLAPQPTTAQLAQQVLVRPPGTSLNEVMFRRTIRTPGELVAIGRKVVLSDGLPVLDPRIDYTGIPHGTLENFITTRLAQTQSPTELVQVFSRGGTPVPEQGFSMVRLSKGSPTEPAAYAVLPEVLPPEPVVASGKIAAGVTTIDVSAQPMTELNDIAERLGVPPTPEAVARAISAAQEVVDFSQLGVELPARVKAIVDEEITKQSFKPPVKAPGNPLEKGFSSSAAKARDAEGRAVVNTTDQATTKKGFVQDTPPKPITNPTEKGFSSVANDPWLGADASNYKSQLDVNTSDDLLPDQQLLKPGMNVVESAPYNYRKFYQNKPAPPNPYELAPWKRAMNDPWFGATGEMPPSSPVAEAIEQQRLLPPGVSGGAIELYRQALPLEIREAPVELVSQHYLTYEALTSASRWRNEAGKSLAYVKAALEGATAKLDDIPDVAHRTMVAPLAIRPQSAIVPTIERQAQLYTRLSGGLRDISSQVNDFITAPETQEAVKAIVVRAQDDFVTAIAKIDEIAKSPTTKAIMRRAGEDTRKVVDYTIERAIADIKKTDAFLKSPETKQALIDAGEVLGEAYKGVRLNADQMAVEVRKRFNDYMSAVVERVAEKQAKRSKPKPKTKKPPEMPLVSVDAIVQREVTANFGEGDESLLKKGFQQNVPPRNPTEGKFFQRPKQPQAFDITFDGDAAKQAAKRDAIADGVSGNPRGDSGLEGILGGLQRRSDAELPDAHPYVKEAQALLDDYAVGFSFDTPTQSVYRAQALVRASRITSLDEALEFARSLRFPRKPQATPTPSSVVPSLDYGVLTKLEAQPRVVHVVEEAPVTADVVPVAVDVNPTYYHGSRVKDLNLGSADPLVGGGRHEFGQAHYLTLNADEARDRAMGSVSRGLPGLPGREFGSPSLHEVNINGTSLLNADAPVAPEIKEVIVNATKEMFKGNPDMRAAVTALARKITKNTTLGKAYDFIASTLVKGGVDDEAQLATLHATINDTLRQLGYDGVQKGDMAAVWTHNKITTNAVHQLEDEADLLPQAASKANSDKTALDRFPDSQYLTATSKESDINVLSELEEVAQKEVDTATKEIVQKTDELLETEKAMKAESKKAKAKKSEASKAKAKKKYDAQAKENEKPLDGFCI